MIIPFLGLFMAIMELGLVFLVNSSLDYAVHKAARGIMTGTAQGAGISTADQFRTTYICPTGSTQLISFIDCTKLIIDVRTATSFSGNDLSNDFYKTQASNAFCPGAPKTITIVRVAYPMPSYLPILQVLGSGFGINRSGLVNDVPNNPGYKHLLVGVSIFQTEAYPTASYSKPTGC